MRHVEKDLQCSLSPGGSWVLISRVISRVTILNTHIKGLITPRVTTHEPPSILYYKYNKEAPKEYWELVRPLY